MTNAGDSWRCKALLFALVLGLAVTGRAAAQVSLDEPLDEHGAKRLDRMEKAMKELRAIVFQGRESGQPIAVQPADTPGQLVGLSDKLADVQQALSRLSGQVEVVRHDLDQSRNEAAALRNENSDLKAHLAVLDAKFTAVATPPPAPVAPPPATAAAALAMAKSALVAGNMPVAEAGFHDVIDRFGDSPLVPEAHYGLAKTLLARRDWPEAATADLDAIRGWPRTRWAPDGVLDLARAMTSLDKPVDACQTLEQLAKHYPLAPTSVRAGAAEVKARAKCG